MPDEKANRVKQLWLRKLSKQANTRTLWQETSDNIYPYAKITSTYEAGEKRTTYIYDMTPMLDMLDTVSGLKHILIPTGQPFFAVKSSHVNQSRPGVQQYLAYVAEVAHEKILNSNFVTEYDDVLRSMIVFGPGDIYSEWTKKTGLNYRSSEIGSYVLFEDEFKNIIGSIHKINLTAEEGYKKFGNKAGDKVIELAKDDKKKYDVCEFLHQILPRENRNPNLSDTYNLNMKYESLYVNLKEGNLCDEGGYPENPYHTARWMRPEKEIDGRGIATELLPQIKVLYQQTKDFVECGNRHNRPPYEVGPDVEGEVNLSPGGRTDVMTMGQIAPLAGGNLNGNFPITEKSLDRMTEIIHRAFFKTAFAPLETLTGDRRTELEIRERIRQTLPKLGPPVGRIWVELLNKLLERSILLLLRNGEIEKPPTELVGTNFGIEYIGPFALALRNSQAKGFQEWVSFVAQMEQIWPGSKDNVDADDAIIRMGTTFGVNVEDIATTEQRDTKRQQRAQELAEQKQAIVAQVASEAYSKTTKEPEKGSPAGQLMGAGV
jgi:hypothetical protein